MYLSRLIRFSTSAAVCAVASAAISQHALEIIPLRHRTMGQILHVLQPLLEPGATLSGHSNQLFLRASPANAAEIRRVLDSIDRPLRRLQISVRFDDASDAARQGVEAGGSVGNRGARVDVRAQDDRSLASERIDQRLQVLEGARGTIYAGQTFAMQDRATGFDVLPRLSGDSVNLEISPQRESGDTFQRVATTVSARLDEWFEIGGVERSASRDDRGLAAAGRASSSASRRIWLKVEEIRN